MKREHKHEMATSIVFVVGGAACNFIKKETLAQVFSCEFCEISKNTFFKEHVSATASLFSYELCKIFKDTFLLEHLQTAASKQG